MINPVFDKQQLVSLFELLNKSSNILIFGHKNPDGDAVGSTLSLHHYLNKKGIKSTVILPDNFPNFLKGLPGTDTIMIYDKNKKEVEELVAKADVIFTLDFNDQTRVGNTLGKALVNSTATKVMIDHHRDPKDYATYLFSDDFSCSTAQLIYEFIEANQDLKLIDKKIGTCIYTGILTDTGSFRYPSTTPKTHEIAGFLIQQGVNNAEIHEQVYDINTLDRLKLLGYTLDKKLEVLDELNVAIISLTKKEMLAHRTQKGYTEGFVNMALSIVGMKMAVFVKEDDKLVKISFRSKGDIFVNEFSAENFNGGGHKNAAGGSSKLSVEATVDKIKKLLPAFLNK